MGILLNLVKHWPGYRYLPTMSSLKMIQIGLTRYFAADNICRIPSACAKIKLENDVNTSVVKRKTGLLFFTRFRQTFARLQEGQTGPWLRDGGLGYYEGTCVDV